MNNNRKKKYLVIDTETGGSLAAPIVYDIGYAIIDNTGKIYRQRSFVVRETFYNADIMSVCYFKNKIPQYIDDIAVGNRVVADFADIQTIVLQDMANYNCNIVCAYNCAFDLRALNNTADMYTIYNAFFPDDTEFNCIMNMATQVLLQRPSYYKKAWENQWYTDKGNVKTSAEIAYRFITNNPNFEENHTGLEDVQIEVKIMVACIRTHKKMDRSIKQNCWQVPQPKWKEYRKEVIAQWQE